MNKFLLIIILLYQIIMAIIDVKDLKKYKNKKITEQVRIKFYKEAILYGWISTLIVFIFIILTPLTMNDIGFRTINFSENKWLNIFSIGVSSIIFVVLLVQSLLFLTSSKQREQVATQIVKNKDNGNSYDSVMFDILIPRTKLEKIWFLFTSLTAGICEEFIWRGTIIYLLQSIFPTINIVIIAIISCGLFGLMHSYQGIYGILKTTFVGILFVMLYISTNSLLLGIVLHFLFDFSSAFLLTDKSNTTIS